MIKRILSVVLLAVSLVASADPFIPGQVLTAAQLNAAFALKPSLTDLAGTGVNQGSTLVGYKRPGAGTVARLLSDKLADTIDAKDYGVKCDNATNDTSAINTMLTAATGKAIRMPPGTCLYAGGGTLGNGTMLIGAGRNSTIIKATTASATLFTVSGYGAGIRSMAFYANVTQTGGSYVWLSGPESFIEDFFMTGDFNGILMTGNVARIKHGRFQDGAAGAIRIKAEGGDNSQMIDDVLMGAQSPQVSAAGIRVRNSSALIISNSSVIQQGHALLIDPYTGTQGAASDAGGVYSLWVHHSFFDNSGGNAIRIAPTGDAPVVRSRFDNIWASSSALDGVYINNTGTGAISGIHFTSPHLMLNGGSGLTTGGTVTDVSIMGGVIANNSQGLYFNSGLTGVHVTGATIGTGGGVAGNTNTGIVVSSGVDQVIIVGNDIRGNATAISNAGGANQFVNNNLGATTLIGSGSFTTIAASGQITSTVATGTAPFVVASTTPVANLAIGGNAATASAAPWGGITGTPTTLSGYGITATSAQLAAAITDETGTGSAVFATSPTLVTPNIGNASGVSLNFTGAGASPIQLSGNMTGATNLYGNRFISSFQSDVTGVAVGYSSSPATAAASFTLDNLQHFRSDDVNVGAGSTITTQAGFFAANLSGAVNNRGFQSGLVSGSNKFNFYASGTADNAYAGNSRFGGTTAPVATVDVTGSIAHSQQEIDKSYTYNAPTTGQTVTLATGTQTAIINPAGTLAALTVTLPACNTAYDGSLARFSSEQAVTVLTVNATSGSVVGGPTSLALGAGSGYICRGSDTTWYRLY